MAIHEPEIYQSAINKRLALRPKFDEYFDAWWNVGEDKPTGDFRDSSQYAAYQKATKEYEATYLEILKLEKALEISKLFHEANQLL